MVGFIILNLFVGIVVANLNTHTKNSTFFTCTEKLLSAKFMKLSKQSKITRSLSPLFQLSYT